MSIPNKAVFINQKKKINNRETLVLNSIDLTASQEINLNKLKENFEKIAQEKKNFDKKKPTVDELPKKYLSVVQLNFASNNYKPRKETNFESLKFKRKIPKSEESKKKVNEKNIIEKISTNEPEVIMVDESEFKYKDIVIDLKNDEINFKKTQNKEINEDKISVMSASESLNSLDEKSRTFVENFFDRKLSSNLNNQMELDKPDNQINQEKVQESVNIFLENLFNYIPNKNLLHQEEMRKKRPEKFSDKVNFLNDYNLENPAIGKIIKNYLLSNNIMTNPKASIFIQKRTFLNCHCVQNGLLCCLDELDKTRDKNLSDKCCNKCSTFEMTDETSHLSDECFTDIIEASNLLSNNEFRRFIRKFRNKNSNCSCFLSNNNFSCCIDAIYESLENSCFKSLDSLFFKTKCCSKCVKPEVIQINEENQPSSVRSSLDQLIELSETDKKRLEIARQSMQESFEIFFSSDNSRNEDKSSNSNVLETDSKSIPVVQNSIIKKPIQIETPRKSIIKTNKKFSHKIPVSKKSVTFEDPKRGFMRIEIPDWLEHLRDPVYTKCLDKYRKEWKN